ncbi:SAM-dependent methyltransferase [Aliiruegeria lutimaris]|uniref:Methyltransferase domain-containing protein n=1 Tax=Aliiruegeria lutimaris TaxID=571298 RepID=A0A1G8ZHZ8_9RHOB|nr:class I SAM-dependent methyltransferase [Aliiruegeria lutimaris]SDK14677.1 Methyltransferase domain-containing protein [Aliiruegeria lutimaris]
MFDILKDFATRPALFAGFDTAALWADPHVARKMLALHLDADHDIASRRHADIDSLCSWVDAEIGLKGRRLLDLGCGPGLYAKRFHAAGAVVTGFDLSEDSLQHARETACPEGVFRLGNYLTDPLPEAEVATLIYGDVCAMPEAARARLFHRLRDRMPAGGKFVLDAFPLAAFKARQEGFEIGVRLDDGFWAEGEYVGLRVSFVYPGALAALDRYRIVEPKREREVFAWLQYLAPERLSAELEVCGFRAGPPREAVTGRPWAGDDRPYVLVATVI